MIITASLVKELRERTGAGMMECKKALAEANGDIEAAIIAMRKSGQAKAAKKAGRIASEGVIAIKVSSDGKTAIMVEVNCETDFVARDSNFLEFVNLIATKGLAAMVRNLEDLSILSVVGDKTVAQMREDLVAKIGENINVRRICLITTSGIIGNYVHNNNRIGVLVEMVGGNFELGKDIAMHIAASKPLVTLPEEVPQDVLNKEKEIYLAQIQNSGKPAAILEKMIVGRMQKFVNELALVKQAFVKNLDVTVEDWLRQNNAKVLRFARFEVGEGIEKKEVDFAAEVKSML